MRTRTRPFLTGFVGVLFLSTAAAALGPPWISIELPANPLDPTTRGALVLVRTYHHGDEVPRDLACALEGIVDGDRRSATCLAEDTRRPGVFAIRGTVPDTGVWMLVVSAGERRDLGTALVEFDAEGNVSGVRVPSRTDGPWTVPTVISDREIDRILRARWGALSGTNDPSSAMQLASLGLLILLPLGGLLVARRRR